MKNHVLLWMLLLLIMCGGCGYRVGSLMHPQIKSVYVAPVVNDTLHYNGAAQLRGLLCEQFMSDGSLKVTGQSYADCELYARLVKVVFQQSATQTLISDGDAQPNQWSVTVTVEFSLILPGRGKPLVGPMVATGSALFDASPDTEGDRRNGVYQGLNKAARNVVSQVTEAW